MRNNGSMVQVTRVVRLLLIANIAAFLVQMTADTFLGTHFFETFGLVPYRLFEHLALWQLVTYQFVHADLFHLLFNMLVLWMLGSELETQWGPRFFTKYYFVCGIAGGLVYAVVQLFFRGTPTNLIPVVGSSGSIYGLLVAYGILYSERTMLFMMMFPMKAKHFVGLLVGVEVFTTVFNPRSGVANLAHLGGMAAGVAYLWGAAYLKRRTRLGDDLLGMKGGKVKGGKARHLRLISSDKSDADDKKPSSRNSSSGGGSPTFH